MLTDRLVQNVVRKEFASATVMTIAHRLHTVADSDRILVMDAGRVVEFDAPARLLAKEGGAFAGMAAALGPGAVRELRAIAAGGGGGGGGSGGDDDDC